METIELCKKLKELNIWPGAEDPAATKDDANGYAWYLHYEGTALETWLPNPGRKALMAELEKELGAAEFEKQILKGRDRKIAHQLFSHEMWMKLLIFYKKGIII